MIDFYYYSILIFIFNACIIYLSYLYGSVRTNFILYEANKYFYSHYRAFLWIMFNLFPTFILTFGIIILMFNYIMEPSILTFNNYLIIIISIYPLWNQAIHRITLVNSSKAQDYYFTPNSIFNCNHARTMHNNSNNLDTHPIILFFYCIIHTIFRKKPKGHLFMQQFSTLILVKSPLLIYINIYIANSFTIMALIVNILLPYLNFQNDGTAFAIQYFSKNFIIRMGFAGFLLCFIVLNSSILCITYKYFSLLYKYVYKQTLIYADDNKKMYKNLDQQIPKKDPNYQLCLDSIDYKSTYNHTKKPINSILHYSKNRNQCHAYNNLSIWSKLTFAWVTRLIHTIHMQGLSFNNFCGLPHKIGYEYCYNKFIHSHVFANDSTAFHESDDKHTKQNTITLTHIILGCCGIKFIALGLLKLFNDCIGFVCPILLSILLQALQNVKGPHNTGSDQTWITVLWSGMSLALATLLSTFLTVNYDLQLKILALRIKTTLTNLLFECVLRTPTCHIVSLISENNVKGDVKSNLACDNQTHQSEPESKDTESNNIKCNIDDKNFKQQQNSSTTTANFSIEGSVLTALSSDIDRITNFLTSFHSCWSLPLQIIITLYLLYTQIGLTFLAGVGLAIIMIPINKWLANRIAHLSERMMEYKDRRLHYVTQFIRHWRDIKVLGLEHFYQRLCNVSRKREMRYVAKQKYLDALCVFFWATTPVLMSVGTFVTYILLQAYKFSHPTLQDDQPKIFFGPLGQLLQSILGFKLSDSNLGSGSSPSLFLDVSKIFTSLALFNMLIAPLNSFPWVINGLVESWISYKRLMRLLNRIIYGEDVIVHRAKNQNDKMHNSSMESNNLILDYTTKYRDLIEQTINEKLIPMLSIDLKNHTFTNTDINSNNSTEWLDDYYVRLDKCIVITNCQFTWSNLHCRGQSTYNCDTNTKNTETLETITIPSTKTFRLIINQCISLPLNSSQLIGIQGPGLECGKSSLLLALMGEMYHSAYDSSPSSFSESSNNDIQPVESFKLTSTISVYEKNLASSKMLSKSNPITINTPAPHYGTYSVAYCGQKPWISCTHSIRANILFGRCYNAQRYQMVIQSLLLHEDFERFPNRDLTMVGENGVTLSGGQLCRIGLARALYQDADLYILDEPLASLDNKVARWVFEKGLQSYLVGQCEKTVIFTSQIHSYIAKADRIWSIKPNVNIDGEYYVTETYNKLGKNINENIVEYYIPNEKDTTDFKFHGPKLVPIKCYLGTNYENASCNKLGIKKYKINENIPSSTNQESNINEPFNVNYNNGNINSNDNYIDCLVYKFYIRNMGIVLFSLIILSFVGMQTTRNACDWWLTFYDISSTASADNPQNPNVTTSFYHHMLSNQSGGGLFPSSIDKFNYVVNSYHITSDQLFVGQFLSYNFINTPLTDMQNGGNTNYKNYKNVPIAPINVINLTLKTFIIVYLCLGIANSIFTLTRAFLFARGGIEAAHVTHEYLLCALCNACPSFMLSSTVTKPLHSKFKPAEPPVKGILDGGVNTKNYTGKNTLKNKIINYADNDDLTPIISHGEYEENIEIAENELHVNKCNDNFPHSNLNDDDIELSHEETIGGQLINRFAADTYVVDNSLPFTVNILFAIVFGLAGTMVIGAWAQPWLLPIILPISLVCYIDLQSYYRRASRDIRRLEARQLSPVLTRFTQTLTGKIYVRNLHNSEKVSNLRATISPITHFTQEFAHSVERYLTVTFNACGLSQWLNLRLQVFGTCLIAILIVLVTLEHKYSDNLSIFPQTTFNNNNINGSTKLFYYSSTNSSTHTNNSSAGNSSAKIGLALSYFLVITARLASLVTLLVETEREFISVERIKTFSDRMVGFLCPTSDKRPLTLVDEHDLWNKERVMALKGEIAFTNVSVSYHTNQTDHNAIENFYSKTSKDVIQAAIPQTKNSATPQPYLALKDVSFNIQAGQKIGVVGRTGAGKSTLFSTLLRLIEPITHGGGTISIDGINIMDIPLKILRGKLIFSVSQTPLILPGTLRFNLDPFERFNDARICERLKTCQLDGLITQRIGSLNVTLGDKCDLPYHKNGNDSKISHENRSNNKLNDDSINRENETQNVRNANLSYGLQQVVCLARALVNNDAKIVLIDEPTANVDTQTQELLTRAIFTSNNFCNSTVLVIAHRIETLELCDKIMVLDRGSMIEFGSTHELFASHSSHLSSFLV